jgi:hypothetical protein
MYYKKPGRMLHGFFKTLPGGLESKVSLSSYLPRLSASLRFDDCRESNLLRPFRAGPRRPRLHPTDLLGIPPSQAPTYLAFIWKRAPARHSAPQCAQNSMKRAKYLAKVWFLPFEAGKFQGIRLCCKLNG